MNASAVQATFRRKASRSLPLYQVQARRVDRSDDAAWFSVEEIRPLPSDQAERAVSELNCCQTAFAYRAIPASKKQH